MDYLRWNNKLHRYCGCREIRIGEGVKISRRAEINVSEYLYIGDRSVINAGAKIEGRKVVIGRESWIHENSWIGGGGCFENTAELVAGDFLHLGKFAHINTAAGVQLGDEVGIGHQSNIWTHGAYPPIDEVFPFQFAPVRIDSRSWLPHAWVNPGVTIGRNVVVGAMSLVNKDLPDGCLAAGIPVEIKEVNRFPGKFDHIAFKLYLKRMFGKFEYCEDPRYVSVNGTIFFFMERKIVGEVTEETERMKDLLRRMGIRFRYYNKEGVYAEWEELV